MEQTNNIVEYRQPRQLSAEDVRAQANLIQQVMKSVMKPNTHYGVIPGCKQPSLYKAGSEALLSTFRIAVDPQVEDLSTEDVIRYRVRAIGTHQASGTVVGVGIGECSSNEDKYKWRGAVCQAEFEATPENRRRVKFYKNGGSSQQIRTNPDDMANTVLKMAKKRAQIDLTLTATAASDIFTQDIEDLPEGYVSSFEETGGGNPGPEPVKEQEKPAMPQEDWDNNLPAYQELIETGKRTAAEIVGKLITKYKLTEAQIKKLQSFKPMENK